MSKRGTDRQKARLAAFLERGPVFRYPTRANLRKLSKEQLTALGKTLTRQRNALDERTPRLSLYLAQKRIERVRKVLQEKKA